MHEAGNKGNVQPVQRYFFKMFTYTAKDLPFASATNPDLCVYPYLGCFSALLKKVKGHASQSKKFCNTKTSTFGEHIPGP